MLLLKSWSVPLSHRSQDQQDHQDQHLTGGVSLHVGTSMEIHCGGQNKEHTLISSPHVSATHQLAAQLL